MRWPSVVILPMASFIIGYIAMMVAI